MRRFLHRDCQHQSLRIGIADVLRRCADQPARDVKRILAAFQHPHEPVHRCICVAVADRFVERRDDVVVLFAALVVHQRPALQYFLDLFSIHRAMRGLHDELKAVQRLARIACRRRGNEIECVFRELDAEFLHARIDDRAVEDDHDLVAFERRDDDNLRPRQQR